MKDKRKYAHYVTCFLLGAIVTLALAIIQRETSYQYSELPGDLKELNDMIYQDRESGRVGEEISLEYILKLKDIREQYWE